MDPQTWAHQRQFSGHGPERAGCQALAVPAVPSSSVCLQLASPLCVVRLPCLLPPNSATLAYSSGWPIHCWSQSLQPLSPIFSASPAIPGFLTSSISPKSNPKGIQISGIRSAHLPPSRLSSSHQDTGGRCSVLGPGGPLFFCGGGSWRKDRDLSTFWVSCH